jgi:hypothetical protein
MSATPAIETSHASGRFGEWTAGRAPGRSPLWLMAALCLWFFGEAHAQTNTPCTLVRVSCFGDSNALVVVTRDDYVALRKEVAQDKAAMDKAFSELRMEWKKRHDRMISRFYTDKDGRQQETQIKAPVPAFPLKHPTDREMHPVAQFPSLEAAEAKKKEFDEEESAKAARAGKRPDFARKTAGDDIKEKKHREDQGYLPDDPSTEQLHEQLMAKFDEIRQTPAAGGDDKGKKDKPAHEARHPGADAGKVSK